MRAIFLALMLSACYAPNSYSDETNTFEAAVKSHEDRLAAAVKSGKLTLTREYYAPNLTGERWFKVEDQYGCKWWINSGHKFDDKQIDVRKDGEANCPDLKNAPEKEFIYRDQTGKQVSVYDF